LWTRQDLGKFAEVTPRLSPPRLPAHSGAQSGGLGVSQNVTVLSDLMLIFRRRRWEINLRWNLPKDLSAAPRSRTNFAIMKLPTLASIDLRRRLPDRVRPDPRVQHHRSRRSATAAPAVAPPFTSPAAVYSGISGPGQRSWVMAAAAGSAARGVTYSGPSQAGLAPQLGHASQWFRHRRRPDSTAQAAVGICTCATPSSSSAATANTT